MGGQKKLENEFREVDDSQSEAVSHTTALSFSLFANSSQSELFTDNRVISRDKILVICWHRAKIEIFLETLEKLLCTSQVLSHIF